jgi:ubiquinone/menaquinone biosynthesis C-methylase UbiE
MHLASIEQRLNNPKLSPLEISQRHVFVDVINRIIKPGRDQRDRAIRSLSISCGNGVWDYLLFKNNPNATEIFATDIVDCPISDADQKLLKNMGRWTFVKVKPNGLLPFEENSFDFVFHQDVIEHTETPYAFLKEQYRVLRKAGNILIGTPNLFRPANVMKLISGRLKFPIKIGFNEEIGDYVHVQEFHEQQLKLILGEVGFTNVHVRHCFFGLPFSNLCFSMYPKSAIGKLMSHFLIFTGEK